MTITAAHCEAILRGMSKQANKDGDWKPIPGFEKYEINRRGDVRRAVRGKGTFVGRALKSRVNTYGYRVVSLEREKRLVHRLLLITFVGPPPENKPNGLHQDGDTTNNSLDNLYWGDQSDNIRDSIEHGTCRLQMGGWQGESHPGTRLTEQDVREIRRRYIKRKNGPLLAEEFCITLAQVCNIVNRKSWPNVY